MTDPKSQNMEDVLLAQLIELYPGMPKTCIEFGATDGLWLSNTARLWKSGWKALLIEPDIGNFENLMNNTKGHDCTCLRRHVAAEGPDQIDNLAARASFPEEVGILSIDVDGDDYHIFNSIKMRPWVIIVEFNATIPPTMDVYGLIGTRVGCSAKAIARVAAEKGYVVWAITGSNSVLVRKDLVKEQDALNTTGVGLDNLLEVNLRATLLFFKPHSITHVVTDYDGRYLFTGPPMYGYREPITEGLQGDTLWKPPK